MADEQDEVFKQRCCFGEELVVLLLEKGRSQKNGTTAREGCGCVILRDIRGKA